MVDWLIKNALILDGSGGIPYQGDVALSGETIAEVGKLSGVPAENTLNAAGKVLTPGFLDIHRHGDTAVFRPDYGKSELKQGLTTVINGNCGMSVAPLVRTHVMKIRNYLAPVIGEMPDKMVFPTMASYLRRVSKLDQPRHFGHGFLPVSFPNCL